MKNLFDEVSFNCSKIITQKYSTSFFLVIRMLDYSLRKPIYGIYGFVRFADEIVDTLHNYNKKELLENFISDTYRSIDEKISLNPVLNSFQNVVNSYDIDKKLIETFINSMRMDLDSKTYTRENYKKYILGSSEVVGLMCLKIFVSGNEKEYDRLRPFAMRLGSVFQKINFLRDLNFDLNKLNRSYFPCVTRNQINRRELEIIFKEIEEEFKEPFEGIFQLPISSRFGVYLAYCYYQELFIKIKKISYKKFLNTRIRISNIRKMNILVRSYIRYQLNRY